MGPADEKFMRAALAQARRGLGRTHPNPVVGAVLVRGGRIVSRGFHRRAGAPHAEVEAIVRAGPKARGADLYTTLEPCNHHGRTPPCTDAILAAGVRRVFCASSDPNPLVSGRGVRRLRRAGVPVEVGVLREEADSLNSPFFKFIKTGLPWVTLKAAVTLDGKLATRTGESRWVSGEAARRQVHSWRDRVDAILVGAGTVVKDDPRLTTRLGRGGRDAVRVVLDSTLRVPPGSRLFSPGAGQRTVVATCLGPRSAKARRLARRGVEVWTVPARRGRVDLETLLRRLGRAGILSVLVEGGAEVFASFLSQELADEVCLFVAPKLFGADGKSWVGRLGISQVAQAVEVADLSAQRVGSDLLLVARL